MMFVRGAAAILLLCATALAQADKDIEKALKDGFANRALTLRKFYAGSKLVFDSHGELVKGGTLADWTVAGQAHIVKIKLESDRLILKGKRTYITFDEAKGMVAVDLPESDVTFEIARFPAPEGEVELSKALNVIFLTKADKLADFVPDYWRPCLPENVKRNAAGHMRCADAPSPGGGASPSDAVYRVGKDVSAPQVLEEHDLDPTALAFSLHAHGTVILSLVVETDGKPRDIRVLRPAGMGLDERAIAAVQRWRFTPGQAHGRPVPVMVSVELTFKLP